MKKKFKLVDLDCANCAAKIERKINELDEVSEAVLTYTTQQLRITAANATVSFLTQKLTLDAEDARFEAVLDEVVRVCKKVEPDCQIVR